MSDLLFYVLAIVFTLAFYGERKKPVLLQELDSWQTISECELIESIIGCKIQYEVIDSGEFAEAIAQAQRHDYIAEITRATAAELRDMCKAKGIPVNARGKVNAQAIAALLKG